MVCACQPACGRQGLYPDRKSRSDYFSFPNGEFGNEGKAGIHEVVWNAKIFTSGVYFYILQAGDFTATKKMILIK